MTQPAILVAKCQFFKFISSYTKREREFMYLTLNSLSLSDSALGFFSNRHVRS